MPDHSQTNVVFIAGPTASGKSAAALALAGAIQGEIVNADAMQVYEDLRIVTARPSPADEARVSHHLYGVIDGAENYSAGRWARAAADVIEKILAKGKTAIAAGGTGLYFKALEEGLSPIPGIAEEFRDRAIARHAELGADAFRAEVIAQDPAMEKLPAGDTQRLLRAFEVFAATGKPLSYFQAAPRRPLIEQPAAKILLLPPRDALYTNCDARAAAMFEDGAIAEVRALIERRLDAKKPVMKALGVAEIAAFLAGECSKEEALAALQQNTRRFAKRQFTWFRNQTAGWPRVETPDEALAHFRV